MKTSTKKGFLFLTSSSAIFLVSGYITNVLLGRFLGPMDYGLYGVVISMISMVSVIQTSGITQAVSKFSAEDATQSENVLKTGLVLLTITSFFFFATFFFNASFIAEQLNDPSLAHYIKISSFVFIGYSMYGLYTDFYNGLHAFKMQAIMNTFYSLGKLVGILGLATFFGLNGAIYGLIFGTFFPLLFGFRLPKINAKFFSFKKLFLFSLPVIGVAIFSNLLFSTDLFLIKKLMTSRESPGYYTAAQNISRLLFYGMSAFYMILLPSISHTVSNNQIDKARNTIQKSLRLIFIIILPSALIISATSKSLLSLIYSDVYIPAAGALSILVIGVSFFTLYTVLSYILTGSGRPKIPFITSILAVLVTIITGTALIPLFGITAAAFATTIGSFIALVIAGIIVYRQFNTFIPLQSFIKILMATGVIYLLARAIAIPTAPIFLPVLYLFLFSLYVGLLILLREITWQDWQQIQEILPSWVPLSRSTGKS